MLSPVYSSADSFAGFTVGDCSGRTEPELLRVLLHQLLQAVGNQSVARRVGVIVPGCDAQRVDILAAPEVEQIKYQHARCGRVP